MKTESFNFFRLIQVVRCCLEHASSVAKTFLMSDCVVVEIKEPEPVPAANPMDNSGSYFHNLKKLLQTKLSYVLLFHFFSLITTFLFTFLKFLFLF